ncbi:GGDEF domain-containing protein [Paenibacillus sp. CAU 1782]
MSPSEVWIPVVFYWLPMLIFFYMGADVLLRNPKKSEHILVSLTILCYFLLFLEEYIRYMLPIEYSPALSALWFANVGIAIPGLGFHLLAKLMGLDKRFPRPWYPYLFHVLLLAIPAGFFSHRELISAQQFVDTGFWKWPVANDAYYGTLTASLVLSLIPIIWLRIVRKRKGRASLAGHYGIFRWLEYGSLLTVCWVVVFGYFRFNEVIPPYSYLYAGLVWCFILRMVMRKYEFLNFSSHRYEKLFHLNPQPILLVSMSGDIKEANPSARQMFDNVDLDSANLSILGGHQLVDRLQEQDEIGELEIVLYNGSYEIDSLLNGDYVTVNNEPHVIVLIRDITARKEHLRQIAFMAYHDPLTELPNRRHFFDKLEQAITDSRDSGDELIVMLIDLDDFKVINDRYGHEAGDLALRHVAAVMSKIAGESGLAARLGGDEFVLYCPPPRIGISDHEMVHRMEETLERDVLEYGGERLTVKMSIGVSRYPQDGTAIDQLIKHADNSMYGIKRSRKSMLLSG